MPRLLYGPGRLPAADLPDVCLGREVEEGAVDGEDGPAVEHAAELEHGRRGAGVDPEGAEQFERPFHVVGHDFGLVVFEQRLESVRSPLVETQCDLPLEPRLIVSDGDA